MAGYGRGCASAGPAILAVIMGNVKKDRLAVFLPNKLSLKKGKT